MTVLPKTSGDLDAYEFYIEMALHWHCASCAAHIEVTGQGYLGMRRGWDVPPLTKEGSLILTTLCRKCARKGGFEVRKVSNQPSPPMRSARAEVKRRAA